MAPSAFPSLTPIDLGLRVRLLDDDVVGGTCEGSRSNTPDSNCHSLPVGNTSLRSEVGAGKGRRLYGWVEAVTVWKSKGSLEYGLE